MVPMVGTGAEAEHIVACTRYPPHGRRGAAFGFAHDERRIAGAALDVFEQEPVDPHNPLLAMDNVIVTPHSLCWTDECFHNMAATGLKSIVDALSGRRPEFVVNPEVLGHARVKGWLEP